VNCAGVFADQLAKMVGVCDYKNLAKAGEIFILDKNLPYAPKCLVNPLPTPLTRGILIVPTLHGNLLLGPTVDFRDDVSDTKTSRVMLDKIITQTRKYIPAINAKDSVTQFVGVRPAIDHGGWTMRAVPNVKGYLEAVGITGGVGAAPAIAVRMRELLSEAGLTLRRKDTFNPIRVGIKRFNKMSDSERNEYIKMNPGYGHVVCRCETVTEAEIVEAIHRTPPAQNLDALKRRLRAGMGRCQGGFCSTRVIEILAKELKVPIEAICKNESGSELVYRKNR
jgi:glycerol-3-phosphate dehydrogenase